MTTTRRIAALPSSAGEVAEYLGWFFTSGRSAQGRPVRLTAGLWELLQWCWSLDRKGREASPLARRMLRERDGGWREESDVLEALSRNSDHGNPSVLAPGEVSSFVGDLLQDGEAARGARKRLRVELEFQVPRLREHPILSTETLVRGLRENGMSASRLRHHLDAVHPERLPYIGAWVLGLDGPGPHEGAAGSGPDEQVLSIPLADAACGSRTRLSLALRHGAELAAVFRLSLAPELAPR